MHRTIIRQLWRRNPLISVPGYPIGRNVSSATVGARHCCTIFYLFYIFSELLQSSPWISIKNLKLFKTQSIHIENRPDLIAHRCIQLSTFGFPLTIEFCSSQLSSTLTMTKYSFNVESTGTCYDSTAKSQSLFQENLHLERTCRRFHADLDQNSLAEPQHILR